MIQTKNSMLTIENYTKLLNEYISNTWKVGEIFKTNSAYLIQIVTDSGKKMQVNLERIAAGNEYELWCWDKHTTIGVVGTATPKRIMLHLNDINDISIFLSHIEFLTKDIRNNY